MDILIEQVVKRKKNAKYFLNILLIILGAILIPTTLFFVGKIIKQAYFLYFAIFAALFCIYLAWLFITGLNIEYEYSALSGTFRVDKIIAKRNRRKVVKLELKTIDEIFKYSDEEMASRKFNKVYNVGKEDYSDENYVATFVSEAKGKCAIVFTPNEKLLKGIRPYLKHEVVRKLYY